MSTRARTASRIIVWVVVVTAGILAVVGAWSWGAAALASGAALVVQVVALRPEGD